MLRGTEPKDYLPFLHGLELAGQRYILEGGQSVNFWASYFQNAGPDAGPLNDYRPFTSVDCDIWVSESTFRFLKREYAGSLVTGDSPSDGQLGVLHLNKSHTRRVDLLSNIFGIPDKELKRTYERALLFDGVRVLDPVFLFRSKCHCLVNLDQSNRQDRKHVGMLALILPNYFRMLHDATVAGEIKERQLIAEMKLFRAFAKDKWIRRALKDAELELDSLLPIALFVNSELRTIAAFAGTTWGLSSTGG